jgi:hypothetical protein
VYYVIGASGIVITCLEKNLEDVPGKHWGDSLQVRQCTYYVTLRRVPATIVAVEKQWALHNLSVCICSIRYPMCHAHAPYCQMWPAPLCNIFPHFLINDTIFEKKKVTDHKMCVVIFTTNVSETFFILRRNERDMVKIVYWSSCKVPFMLVQF